MGTMEGLTECLSFTSETEEDFAGGWLPTLDVKLRVVYHFFEKTDSK